MTGTLIRAHEPARLEAAGAFDRDNRHRIRTAVQQALADGHPYLTIDFAEVTLIDAATIRTLLDCHALALARGGDLRIVRANGVIEFLLEVAEATFLLD